MSGPLISSVAQFHPRPSSREIAQAAGEMAQAAINNEGITRGRVEALEQWRVEHAARYERLEASVGEQPKTFIDRLRWLFLGR